MKVNENNTTIIAITRAGLRPHDLRTSKKEKYLSRFKFFVERAVFRELA